MSDNSYFHEYLSLWPAFFDDFQTTYQWNNHSGTVSVFKPIVSWSKIAWARIMDTSPTRQFAH